MKKKTRFFSFLLSLLLCLGVVMPMPASAANLYFTSLNDNLLPLTADSMPFWSGGVLYVPYTVFDSSATGVNLDIYPKYNRSKNMVTLIGMEDQRNPTVLLFDLNKGIAQDDISKTPLLGRAIVRSGIPYLPVSTVCSFFNLTYSYSTLSSIKDGYLVRIKSDDAVLSDARFIDAAYNLLTRRLKEYNQSIVTPPPPPPAVVPAPEPEPVGQASVYLGVLCRDGEGLHSILSALRHSGSSALFFVSPDFLTGHADSVHQILAMGYSVGLLAEADSWKENSRSLRDAQELLEQLAFTSATAVYVPAEQRAEAEKAGWVCWTESLVLTPGSKVSPSRFADSTIRRVRARSRAAYLTLSDGADTGRILPALLSGFSEDSIHVRLPLETML